MAISTSSDRTSLLRRVFAPDRTMATKVPHVGALVVFLLVLTWLERSGHDRPHHGGHGSDGGHSETPGPRFAE